MTKLIFMGTPDFSATVLKGLLVSGQYEILAVVTQPDRAERRKKEILKLIDNLYFEFGTKNPISIYKGLGIEIVSANIEMKGLYTVVLNSKLIVVQSLLEGFAKLFVIGHELFHALEHDCDEIRFFREHTGFKTSIYEEEANFFSVQLLKDYIEYHQDEVADLEIAEEIEKFM